MIEDHEYLDEAEVKVLDDYGIIVDGIVVMADRDIGLTIVKKDNHDHHSVCLNGPLSANKAAYEDWKDVYDAMFDVVIKMIEEGTVDFARIHKAAKADLNQCGGEMECAFSL